ncbi:MAG: Rne/Rng family ribonuclease [Hyphomicrobiales bacterium]|nr:Rne/Rng family ribonuclease [Hyphomicrobiales bacterium]
MGNKMLIDAAHPEETRVVVVRGNRVEEFDFESQSRKQLRGSIFLAKVIRVEPSLQAAFVDYGGNRHGFLAFAEIHPDYYRIPYAEGREARAAEAQTEASPATAAAPREAPAETDADDDSDAPASGETSREETAHANEVPPLDAASDAPDAEDDARHDATEAGQNEHSADAADPGARNAALAAPEPTVVSDPLDDDERAEPSATLAPKDEDEAPDSLDVEDNGEHGVVESVGGEDALEEVPQRDHRRRRHYKIQEVIKRNLLLLVQVVKEERGTKGAALTTYLSLAGRYTVLMPNTASGGGISRKINVVTDRKRLKEIATELEVPQGMGLIIRTAGAARTKAEIKRDFEYLLRLWETVRDLTLKSKAPTLVYEEGDLIKRSIRDLYSREIDEVLVAGDDAYREAKDFMRMLMPSHAKNVQPYKEPEPIFTRHGVEGQLNMMFNPRVTLKSGGYIIINQTEALVAVDVNSGKSTREHSIEETALKTNLEAADEVARQLRLRDLAGLIVIDFIDMEERRNNRLVEKKLKDCLRNDRARIQVGRISPFGLLEMSRQRLRTGMVEGSTQPCSHCNGTGVIRSTESVALMILRAIEDMLIAKGRANLAVGASAEVALYILNNKRNYLRDIENRYGVTISVIANPTLFNASYTLDKVSPPTPREGVAPAKVQMTWAHHVDEAPEADAADDDTDEEANESAPAATEDGAEQRSRRRRRRRRGRNGHDAAGADGNGERREATSYAASANNGAMQTSEDDDAPAQRMNGRHAPQRPMDAEGGDEQRRSRRSRRRGRRGGRGQRPGALGDETHASAPGESPGFDEALATPEHSASETESAGLSEPQAPFHMDSAAEAPPAVDPAEASAPTEAPMADISAPEPQPETPAKAEEPAPPPPPKRTGPARGGWWQRRIG